MHKKALYPWVYMRSFVDVSRLALGRKEGVVGSESSKIAASVLRGAELLLPLLSLLIRQVLLHTIYSVGTVTSTHAECCALLTKI